MNTKYFDILQYIKDKKLAIDLLNNTTIDDEIDMMRKGYKRPTLLQKKLRRRRKKINTRSTDT